MRSVLLVVSTVMLALAGCGSEEAHQSEASVARATVSVRTEQARSETLVAEIELTGVVRARETAVISAQTSGSILALHVREGDRVRRGQSLIDIDDRAARAALGAAQAARAEAERAIEAAQYSVESAQAGLQLAQTTHGRFEELAAKDSLTKQELDESTARLRQAEAGTAVARSQKARAESGLARAEAQIVSTEVMLGYSQISSPFDGVVVERLDDPGGLATPGKPLLRIEKEGAYRLEAAVPESHLSAIEVGREVRLSIRALGESGLIEGRVQEIVPTIDPASRTFVAKISLPADRALRSGLYGTAILEGANQDVITVPAEAVLKRGQLESIFVVEDAHARQRLVKLGEQREGRLVVLAGVRAGDEIVLGPGALVDGTPVTVSAREATQ